LAVPIQAERDDTGRDRIGAAIPKARDRRAVVDLVLTSLPFGAHADQSGDTCDQKNGDANPGEQWLSIQAPLDLLDFPDQNVHYISFSLLKSFGIERHNKMILPNSRACGRKEYEDAIL
jgi:hypothetical protein